MISTFGFIKPDGIITQDIVTDFTTKKKKRERNMESEEL